MKSANFKNRSKHCIKSTFTILVLILLATSCQKEVTGDIGTPSTTPPPTTTSANVKTYSVISPVANGIYDTTTFNLSYDANNRIVGLISATEPNDKIVYKYNTNNTYTMDIIEANAVTLHEIFFLNNIPLVDSSVQYNVGLSDTTTEKYIYNSKNQLINLKTYNHTNVGGSNLISNMASTYDNNGNVVKEVSGTEVTTYTYYPDLVNNLAVGMLYFYQNKNLVKTTTEPSGILSSGITNHTYTFDTNNRLTSETRTFDGKTVIQRYTY
jgi:hypothetical protein